KCVAAGTQIYTEHGLVPIETVGAQPAIGEYQLIQLRVHTDGGMRAATHMYYGGHQPVYTVRAKGGLAITCTADHRLRIVDENGDYAWRRSADLQPGDYVAISAGRQAFGCQEQLPTVELPTDLATTNFRELKLPERWTPSLARFLGYVTSEGYIY